MVAHPAQRCRYPRQGEPQRVEVGNQALKDNSLQYKEASSVRSRGRTTPKQEDPSSLALHIALSSLEQKGCPVVIRCA